MSLLQHVNNSGFPLQIALSHLVDSTNSRHGWKVLYKEHAWKNQDASGFIDLVLEDRYRTWLMNIECKRVQDATWIFLVANEGSNSRRSSKLWVTKISGDQMPTYGWHDIPMDPQTYQSEFCVVPGQDAKSRPMLERIAADVVASTEALALEEAAALSDNYSNLRIYQNVIVTTADLKICKLSPEDIDLSNGKVENVDFIDVPFVRFRKQLAHVSLNKKPRIWQDEIRSLTNRKENTVFIVRASEFLRFLGESDLPDNIGQHIGVR